MMLGLLGPLGMLGTSGLMLLDLRKDAWERAEQTSKNLVQALELDIAQYDGDDGCCIEALGGEMIRIG